MLLDVFHYIPDTVRILRDWSQVLAFAAIPIGCVLGILGLRISTGMRGLTVTGGFLGRD